MKASDIKSFFAFSSFIIKQILIISTSFMTQIFYHKFYRLFIHRSIYYLSIYLSIYLVPSIFVFTFTTLLPIPFLLFTETMSYTFLDHRNHVLHFLRLTETMSYTFFTLQKPCLTLLYFAETMPYTFLLCRTHVLHF